MVRILTLFLLLSLSSKIFAQEWVEKMNNPQQANFYDIQKAFNSYWNGREIEKGQGYKQFKRWEHRWENRIKPDGTFYEAGKNSEEWQKYLSTHVADRNAKANWQPLGPNTSPGGYAGLGRIASIAFHPTNLNIIWAGSAGGGLWKTTNGGTSWQTTTDTLPVLGVSGIIIEKNNPNVMYIATGDGDAGDNYSVGVLKSTDGGINWSKTGLNWAVNSQRRIRKIVQDPDNVNNILAATTNGIYQTLDAGANWKQVKTGNFYDIEINPKLSTNTFYASTGNEIQKSTDNGATWTVKQTFTGTNRIAIAASPSADSVVYALCSKSSDSGLMGVFRSTNSGNTFVLQADKPNILSGSQKGDAAGGQGWYDLIITVDPLNAGTLYTGGVTTWKSTDNGLTWNLNTFWYSISGVPAVHADKHVFEWQNNSTLWEGNDGGVYKTTNGGTAWTHLSNTMEISQMYRMGVSQKDAKAITGLQDNGTKLRSNTGTWSDVIGGDGMQCAIHPANASVMYGCIQNGELRRSNNGGSNWVDIQNNIPGQPGGAWITPFALHPSNANFVVAGYKEVYKSNNQGGSWTTISKNLSNSNLSYVFVANSDSNYIYAAKRDTIYKTSDGGATWSKYYTPGGSISNFCIHPLNPEILWAVRGNYSAGQKVYKSINGGISWTNISGSLPNVNANCIEYQRGTKDGLYVGMDVGLFYRDSTMSDWVLFADGLPNVEVTDLEIKYDEGKIYASTYGRGLWKSDWYTCSVDSNKLVVQNCTSFTWNNKTYTESGTYAIPYQNKFGCDSVVSLQLTILPTSSATIETNACSSYSLNGKIYNKTGTYVQSFKNAQGCDSTLTLNLTINEPTFATQTLSTCEPFTWFDSTYSQSGTFFHVLTNSLGCDSTITLNLTVGSQQETSEKVAACNSYQWNGETYQQSGNYSKKFLSSIGCDSIAKLELTIDTSINIATKISSCTSYNWNGEVFTNSGNYTQKFKSYNGCDSTVQLELTILPIIETRLEVAACEQYTWNDKVYTSSTKLTGTFTGSKGCDSLVEINLTILPKSTYAYSDVNCGSYTWNGQVYTASGTYLQKFKNTFGCDSTVTLELKIIENSFSEETLSSCVSYNWFGVQYFDSGTYTHIIPNSEGCDSVMTLNLNILKATSAILERTACESFSFNNTTYTNSGAYTIKTKNSAGCDSTITLNLTINKAIETPMTAIACGPYTLNNQVYNSSGIYFQKFKSAVGCDSTVRLDLSIVKIDTSILVTTNSLKSNAIGATYQWIDCNKNNAPIKDETFNAIIPQKSGNYAVVIQDRGCVDTSNCYLFIISGLGLISDNDQIKVYPNPVTQLLTIESENEMQGAMIRLTNNQGQLVQQVNSIFGKTLQMDLIDLPSGVFFLQIHSHDRVYLTKVLKE